MSGDARVPQQRGERPPVEPTMEDELAAEWERLGGGNPENPGLPTPGSDNDGPEEGYTPPEELRAGKGRTA